MPAIKRQSRYVWFLRVGPLRARVGTWTYGGEGSAVRCPRVRTWCAWVEVGGRFYGRAG